VGEIQAQDRPRRSSTGRALSPPVPHLRSRPIRLCTFCKSHPAPESISGTSRGALFRTETYVNWCGHAQGVIPIPRPDGLVAFVPVLGEAA